MSDLAAWLLEQIQADEDLARSAGTPGPWRYTPGVVHVDDYEESVFAGPRGPAAICVASTGPLADPPSMRDAAHIAHWDPVRVLAECAAKRRIIELHESWPVLAEGSPEFATPTVGSGSAIYRITQRIAWLTQEEYRKRFGDEPPTTPMLRALALAYADRDGYREEWKP